jgi:ubiquinone/menaquinone biosynthesis C-methylase UbiE
MTEQFKPVSNTPPDSFGGKMKFFGRMVLDLQMLTIFRDIKKTVPTFNGSVLDVGCGQSPYRFLLDTAKTDYKGVDIMEADKFDYNNPDITHFNGGNIPFDDEIFEGVICTEVLEHVQNYQKLIDEMYRVMKKGATGIITVPWSARNHYIPYDFFRYTPSSLRIMFNQFSVVTIQNRGTDLSNIANKIIVLWFRNLSPTQLWKWIFVPLWILLLPVLIMVVLTAHLSLWFHLGSAEDPLGYTILIKK